ncbi:hypothetical protein FACS1894202_02120 [Clostridia bacterium]|nr:hypothetical protein FACS1894202_02120 [Clostridia bacterium]
MKNIYIAVIAVVVVLLAGVGCFYFLSLPQDVSDIPTAPSGMITPSEKTTHTPTLPPMNRNFDTSFYDRTFAGYPEYGAIIAILPDKSLWLDNFSKPVTVQNVKQVEYGEVDIGVIFYIDENDNLYGLGILTQGGITKIIYDTPTLLLENAKYVRMGEGQVLALQNDGTLWGWGDNRVGQLAHEEEYIETPVKIMEGVRFISAGQYVSAALKEDGSLWLWGSNAIGAIGNGERGNGQYPQLPGKSVLEPYNTLNDVVFMSVGGMGSYAITSDYALWAWGGEYGNLPIKIADNMQFVCNYGSVGYAVDLQGNLFMTSDLGTPFKKNVRSCFLCVSNLLLIKYLDGSLWSYNADSGEEVEVLRAVG